MIKKANEISKFMTSYPQLCADSFGRSMAEAFACGVDPVVSGSAVSPYAFACLVGAYTDRNLHLTNVSVATLAPMGAAMEAV